MEFKNTVFNENCFDVMKRMPDKCVDMILTDPPYGMKYQSNHRPKHLQFNEIENDHSLDFVPDLLREFMRICKDDAHVYIFAHWSKWYELHLHIIESGWTLKNMLIWEKNNWGMGDLKGQWAISTELIAFISKGRKELNGKRPVDVIHCDRVDPGKLLHPTQKPTGITNKIMKVSSKPGDLVFDPFAGSGSTLVSAARMGRDYCGCEIDENYFKIIQRRVGEEKNSLF